MNASPRDEYGRRGTDAQTRADRLGRLDRRLSWARLATIALALGLGVAAIRGAVAPVTLAIPVLAFIALAVVHDRVLQRRRATDTLMALYRDGRLRLDDAWAGHGDMGARFAAQAVDHLYAGDLDLYGNGSLFELLNTARTPIGQRTLARWLEAPAQADEARARQAAVKELAPRLDLREELALAGGAMTGGAIREEALSAWALTAPPGLPARLGMLQAVLLVLALALATAAGLWFSDVWSGWPVLGTVVAAGLVGRRFRGAVAAIIAGVEKRTDELTTIVSVMGALERERFEAPLLRQLADALRVQGQPPSLRVARLRRRVAFLEARRNQFMALLLAPFQWSTQLALAIEAWRRSDGPSVGPWMHAVGTLDALLALATFAYEHPEYPFPDIRDGDAPSLSFEALGLGHPLLPAAQRVVNDVALGGTRRLLLVSGSNMSGKSTLLRSVGVNAALALAGAPVCARALALSPVQVGATLRINDSLQEGKSRFYAELTRLKQIVDCAGHQPPLLFLLDEILHGTNSHDRRIGAEAVVRGLVARGAIGLVTTHDLALTEMADRLADGAATNVHFEDHLENGVMTFDYAMKPGVVRKSNALALMRAVGLDVDE